MWGQSHRYVSSCLSWQMWCHWSVHSRSRKGDSHSETAHSIKEPEIMWVNQVVFLPPAWKWFILLCFTWERSTEVISRKSLVMRYFRRKRINSSNKDVVSSCCLRNNPTAHKATPILLELCSGFGINWTQGCHWSACMRIYKQMQSIK